jgi:acetyl-CoA decarbonylase/synthase complex subunit gamma
VQYGPVRAEDLRAFLSAGMEATPDMRRVHFRLRDRAAVVPVELVWSARYALLIAAGFFLLSGLGPDGYSWARLAGEGLRSVALLLGAWAGSTVLAPLLLPWLPGRALSAKGAWLGLVFLLGIVLCARSYPAVLGGWLNLAAWCLLVPTVASFMAMNFTGATTYTSLSGVRREMRFAVPIQAAAAGVGVVLWLIGRFV